uniref:RNA polymerase II subunit A C-terminal domain phosphatase SSU72 n=1 Tax=Sinocyclocheilus rhinocerous TaxID=307959 RepID=A0A673L655_9TELE
MPAHPLRVAVVCSSNQNRSMEAHNILSKRGFDVRSFGTGTHVKLPGPAPDKPNIYDFKTTYEQMYNDLVRKDKELYFPVTFRISAVVFHRRKKARFGTSK